MDTNIDINQILDYYEKEYNRINRQFIITKLENQSLIRSLEYSSEQIQDLNRQIADLIKDDE